MLVPQKPNSEKVKMKTSLPVRKAKKLIKPSGVISHVGFLGGKQGKEINAEIQAKYNNFPALQIASYSMSVIKGSNPFYVVAVNEILRQNEINAGTATQADLERVLKKGTLNLKAHFEDSALVLRNEGDPNAYLAKDLIKQIRERTNEEEITPLMIPLAGLELRTDQDSKYGLAFNLTDDSQIIYAPQLVHINNEKRFNEAEDKGMPKFDKGGERTLYTRCSGLSRLYLNNDLDLVSVEGNLADSGRDGRVIVSNK